MLLKVGYLVFIRAYHAKRGLLCPPDTAGWSAHLSYTRYWPGGQHELVFALCMRIGLEMLLRIGLEMLQTFLNYVLHEYICYYSRFHNFVKSLTLSVALVMNTAQAVMGEFNKPARRSIWVDSIAEKFVFIMFTYISGM
jgi:hypothetical protein